MSQGVERMLDSTSCPDTWRALGRLWSLLQTDNVPSGGGAIIWVGPRFFHVTAAPVYFDMLIASLAMTVVA